MTLERAQKVALITIEVAGLMVIGGACWLLTASWAYHAETQVAFEPTLWWEAVLRWSYKTIWFKFWIVASGLLPTLFIVLALILLLNAFFLRAQRG
jgi:hypothetical protein